MLLLAAVSSSAMAEWVKIGTSETDTLYFDPAIRWSDKNTSKMWTLNDFKVTQQVNEREAFKSAKMVHEYDCTGQQFRLLYYTSHTESMAEGNIVDFNVVPTEWLPVLPNTGQEELLKIACGKA